VYRLGARFAPMGLVTISGYIGIYSELR
jgi:hypothetical protein